MKFIFIIISLLIFYSSTLKSQGLDVFGLGFYDVLNESSSGDETIDIRYERRFSNSILEIGPEDDNFFFLKPFAGFEFTGESASYFLAGIYLEDNLGQLFQGEENKLIFTPSLGAGYYNDGSGKKLGHEIEFRTSLEISYSLKNNNRIGISLSHISNANIGDKNPGVEILSISYQIPY